MQLRPCMHAHGYKCLHTHAHITCMHRHALTHMHTCKTHACTPMHMRGYTLVHEAHAHAHTCVQPRTGTAGTGTHHAAESKRGGGRGRRSRRALPPSADDFSSLAPTFVLMSSLFF